LTDILINGKTEKGLEEGQKTFREKLLFTIISALNPEIIKAIDRIAEVPELLALADVTSVGENQLHHVLRVSQLAALIPDGILRELEVDRADLVQAAIFHDLGKGTETDDRYFRPELISKVRVPKKLSKFNGLKWAEWRTPFHDHVLIGYEIGVKYNLKQDVLEAIALHHHVKIRSNVIEKLGPGLILTSTICQDIASYAPEQYAAPGGTLAQVLAFLDQLCAVERKLKTHILTRYSEDRLEEDVVRDLVIGVTDKFDPRLQVLGVTMTGVETVILVDLSAFGSFVKMHSEYEIQRVKKSILQTIRSVVRSKEAERERDLVSLIGGDEFVVITGASEQTTIDGIIDRIAKMIKIHSGLNIRPGYGIGKTIIENFHAARAMAEVRKKSKFLV